MASVDLLQWAFSGRGEAFPGSFPASSLLCWRLHSEQCNLPYFTVDNPKNLATFQLQLLLLLPPGRLRLWLLLASS